MDHAYRSLSLITIVIDITVKINGAYHGAV